MLTVKMRRVRFLPLSIQGVIAVARGCLFFLWAFLNAFLQAAELFELKFKLVVDSVNSAEVVYYPVAAQSDTFSTDI